MSKVWNEVVVLIPCLLDEKWNERVFSKMRRPLKRRRGQVSFSMSFFAQPLKDQHHGLDALQTEERQVWPNTLVSPRRSISFLV